MKPPETDPFISPDQSPLLRDQDKIRNEESLEAVGGRGEGKKELGRDTPMAGVGAAKGDRSHTRGAAMSERLHRDEDNPPNPPRHVSPGKSSSL